MEDAAAMIMLGLLLNSSRECSNQKESEERAIVSNIDRKVFWMNAKNATENVGMKFALRCLKDFSKQTPQRTSRMVILPSGVFACVLGKMKEGTFVPTHKAFRNTLFAFPSGAVFLVDVVRKPETVTVICESQYGKSDLYVTRSWRHKDIGLLLDQWDDSFTPSQKVWYLNMDLKTPFPVEEVEAEWDKTIESLTPEQYAYAFEGMPEK